MFAIRKGQVRLKVNPLDLDQKPLWAFLVEVSLSLSFITTYCQQSLLYMVIKSKIYQINNRLSFIITHCQQSLVNPWLRWDQLHHCTVTQSLVDKSNDTHCSISFFSSGLGWHLTLPWLTWQKVNKSLKMKLLTQTERSEFAEWSSTGVVNIYSQVKRK